MPPMREAKLMPPMTAIASEGCSKATHASHGTKATATHGAHGTSEATHATHGAKATATHNAEATTIHSAKAHRHPLHESWFFFGSRLLHGQD